MAKSVLSPMEIDAIGEMMNISLGSSATAVSSLLDHRVSITTPVVQMTTAREFTLGKLDPAVGVEIKYVVGLEGSNIMLLKRNDVKIILDILMGSETPDEEFQLDELTISAICEVMNQMMGSAATAMSEFLGHMVNISPPTSIELSDFEAFKAERFPSLDEPLIVVWFSLTIEDTLKSEFVNIMSVPFAREILAGIGLTAEEEEEAVKPVQVQPVQVQEKPVNTAAADHSAAAAPGAKLTQEGVERLINSMNAEPITPAPEASRPSPAPAAPPPSTVQYAPSPGYPAGYWPNPYPPEAYAQYAEPKVLSAQPVRMPSFAPQTQLSKEQASNLDLIMSVPLEVIVEIGRTRRKVQEILEFTKGSLVVLDKLAGDQVDLYVNGKCIGRGDVVVIDDNFGIRITEILQQPSLEDLTQA